MPEVYADGTASCPGDSIMVDVWTLSAIREHVQHKATDDLFERELDTSRLDKVTAAPTLGSVNPLVSRLCGILLARPDHSIAQNEVIPGLGYFHYRSGCSIDLFCAGYGQTLNTFSDAREVVASGPDGSPWLFSDEAFAGFVHELEDESTWEYGGGPELILLASHFDAGASTSELDFSYMLPLDLQRAIDDGAITSVKHFFEDLFREAASSGLERLSDVQGARTFLKGITDHLLEKVPLGLGKAAKRASHFKVSNFSRVAGS